MANVAQSYIAIDLGATNGRVFAGRRSADILELSEVRRFPNSSVTLGGSTHWDVSRIWNEIRAALAEVSASSLAGIGVDAWGVDYALLGKRGELLQNPYHYRDPRNVSAMSEVLQRISKEEIYRQTGVQFMAINTLYQLFAAKRDAPEVLAVGERLILIPDLFHYWMAGNAVCEYTVASTTQFASPVTRTWASTLLEKLELPAHLPGQLVEPGTIIGSLLPSVAGTAIAGVPVIAPASHDTASAVAAVEARGDTAFLSSGTWSLLGTELDAPIVSPRALQLNFTNEGGINGTTRLLRNVMGLWMLECCRKQWAAIGLKLNYEELVEAANAAPAFGALVDPDDPSFLNPVEMTLAIDNFCARSDQPKPRGPEAYVRVILESLALKYRITLRDLESITGQPVRRLRVIGGGSQNRLLNQFTANATGRQVMAGPAEAAVLGNIGVQMLATGDVKSLREMRALIDRSFGVETFEPQDTNHWDRQAARFEHYCEYNFA